MHVGGGSSAETHRDRADEAAARYRHLSYHLLRGPNGGVMIETFGAARNLYLLTVALAVRATDRGHGDLRVAIARRDAESDLTGRDHSHPGGGLRSEADRHLAGKAVAPEGHLCTGSLWTEVRRELVHARAGDECELVGAGQGAEPRLLDRHLQVDGPAGGGGQSCGTRRRARTVGRDLGRADLEAVGSG